MIPFSELPIDTSTQAGSRLMMEDLRRLRKRDLITLSEEKSNSYHSLCVESISLYLYNRYHCCPGLFSRLPRRQPAQIILLNTALGSSASNCRSTIELLYPLTTTMGIAFDYAPERPEHIDAILNGLDRYNPETTTVFQDYVTQQCEDRTYDCYANLALLKL